MIAGLLQCDPGPYEEMFREWLPVEWRVYKLIEGRFPSLDECDAWVATGSRFSVYDDVDWIRRFAELVREIDGAQRPFVGVCFGHQMMAHALGGRVARTGRGWGVGVHEFRIHAREPWMDPPLQKVSMLMSCQDQVELLPPGAVVMASSEHCPVGIYRRGTLLGIQGHPEWTPEYAAKLLTQRRERIGAALADVALESLSRPANSSELAAWAMRWLSQQTV